MLRAAFKNNPDVKIVIINPRMLVFFLQRAKEEGRQGKVTLMVGQKEIEAKRYRSQEQAFPDHLTVRSLPPFFDGLSGTEVRQALKDAALKRCEGSIRKLHEALDYVEDPLERELIVRALIRGWKIADAAAARFRPAKKGEKKSTKKGLKK